MPEASVKSLKRRLDGEEPGGYSSLNRMAPEMKQDVVNDLFNNRDIEVAKGLTGYQSAMDVNYFGSTVRMKPMEFLNLALRRGDSLSDKVQRKDFASHLAKEMRDGKNPKLGPPKLWLDIQGDKVVVTGHEGRHRSDAILEMFGGDTKIPVDVQFRNEGNEFRARKLTEDIFDKPLVTEDGKGLSTSLRDMLGAAGVMAILNQGENDEL